MDTVDGAVGDRKGSDGAWMSMSGLTSEYDDENKPQQA
jgi:hypothetical protein